MFETDGIGQAIAERIVELHSATAEWTRRLWRSSVTDALRHCLAVSANGGRDSTKSWALDYARKCIEADPFISPRERGPLLKSLAIKPEKLVNASTNFYKLAAVEAGIAGDYWEWVIDWANRLRDRDSVRVSGVDVDKISWHVGAHLRAAHLSDAWVVNFFTYHLKRNPAPVSLALVLEEARSVAMRGEGEWTFLVPLTSRRGFNITEAPPFLNPAEFDARFRTCFPAATIPTNRGGFEFNPITIDKYAAVQSVERQLSSIMARHSAANSKRLLQPSRDAWVSPGSWTTRLDTFVAPRVRFPSLDSRGGARLFDDLTGELEASLDLLIAGDRTSVRASAIAAWSALETLFADESDFGELANIADRAADILLCVFVRDELSGLARGHARSGSDGLSARLRGLSKPDQAAEIAAAVASQDLDVNPTLGEVAVQRARSLDQRSIITLKRQIATALRRLYDVRNQIVHAGTVEPYGLHSTYSEAAILISALVDELIVQSDKGFASREVAGKAGWLVDTAAEGTIAPSQVASL